MQRDETRSFDLTIREETIDDLLEQYPTAIEPTEAIRMAIEDALFARQDRE